MVLSQYILMSQEAGSNPPQETGLMTNSWYGKFHLESMPHHRTPHHHTTTATTNTYTHAMWLSWLVIGPWLRLACNLCGLGFKAAL